MGTRLTSLGGTAAGLNHTRGGIDLDGVHVLAGADIVTGLADSAVGDGVLNAGLGLAVAGNDLLGARSGGESEDGEGELHFGSERGVVLGLYRNWEYGMVMV